MRLPLLSLPFPEKKSDAPRVRSFEELAALDENNYRRGLSDEAKSKLIERTLRSV